MHDAYTWNHASIGEDVEPRLEVEVGRRRLMEKSPKVSALSQLVILSVTCLLRLLKNLSEHLENGAPDVVSLQQEWEDLIKFLEVACPFWCCDH